MNNKVLLKKISEIISGELAGDPEIEISGVSGIESVTAGQITFADNERFFQEALKTECSAVICPAKLKDRISGKPVIFVKNPKLAFAKTLELFSELSTSKKEISGRASVSEKAVIGKNCSIGDFCVIEDNAVIGNNVRLYPNVYIGNNVKIGDNTTVYPGAVIYYNCVVGNNCIIHANTVIGTDGFGYAMSETGHYKVPQIGNVVIGDNVELGSHVSVDRATTKSTVIGNGVKIDDHVHLAHNVKVGDNSLIISSVAVAGSSNIGKNCIIAGHSAVRDHVTIGDNVIVIAKSGVTKDLKPNQIVSGFPAKPHSEEKKLIAFYSKLPELAKTVKNLEQSVVRLQNRIENLEH